MRTSFMMKKLHTLIFCLLAGTLLYLAADWHPADEYAADARAGNGTGGISQIRAKDNSRERYIDWNSPGLSAAGTEYSAERSPQQSGSLRNQNSAKAPCRDSCWLKDGKIFSERMLHEFRCPLWLFPSGTESKDHRFIILRKLVI